MTDPYSERAPHFFNQYQQLVFEDVHRSWLHHLPGAPAHALDIGAGSGRDAAALARWGWQVLAVEPAAELRQLAEETTKDLAVQWVEDSLPELSRVHSPDQRFHLILVSAVWMHLPPSQRHDAFSRLTDLLAPSGVMVITLRHGPEDGERTFHKTSRGELEELARTKDLTTLSTNDLLQRDRLGRDDVWWETVVLIAATRSPA